MRIIQRGTSPDIAAFYLCGAHLDHEFLRALGPSPWLVAFDDAHGQTPQQIAIALRLERVRSIVLVGYSAGCMGVRSALRTGALPVVERLGVVAIDGTHANWPPADWQVAIWHDLAEQARRGAKLFVATCTAQTYVEQLERPFASTLTVLRRAIDPTLTPSAPPDERHDGDLHVYAYASKAIDRDAHIAQQRGVLPAMLAAHVAPWLERG